MGGGGEQEGGWGISLITKPGGVAEGTRFVSSPTLGHKISKISLLLPDRASVEALRVQP